MNEVKGTPEEIPASEPDEMGSHFTVALAGSPADPAALASENARLSAEIRQKNIQLEVASRVSQIVISNFNLDELLAEVVSLIRNVLGYYQVNVFLVDDRAREIVLHELSGEADIPLREQGLRLKIGEGGITAWVAGSGEPLLCNDVRHEPRYHPHELLPRTMSEAAVPMRVGRRVIGVLDVQSEQLNAFQGDTVTTFQILADQIAIAITNARLFQATQHQVEVLSALHQISLDITSQLETERVLDLILKQAARFLEAQGSVLAIYTPDTEVVRIRAGHNVSDKTIGVELDVGEGVAGQVVAQQRPVFVNDYNTWQRRSPKLIHNPFNAVLGVPLRWHGQVIGALVVLDERERRPFSEDDAQLLTLFADLASIALKNAELYEAIQKSSHDLEHKVVQRTQELSKAKQALAQTTEQLRDLLRVTVNVQEEERARIALDLHDGSNQLITGVLYEIQAAQLSIRGSQTGLSLEKLETAKRLLRMIEAENRRLIAGLRPPLLDSEGLVPALRWQTESFQAQYGILCNFQVSGEPIPLAEEVEMAIYRIAQESLNNVVEHAQARKLHLRVEFRPARFVLTISDDGIGFDPESDAVVLARRVGLVGMRERAESIGGSLQAHSTPGQGTRITLKVPLVEVG